MFPVVLSYVSSDSWLEANEMNSGCFKQKEEFLKGYRSLWDQWESPEAQVWKSRRKPKKHWRVQK